MTDIAVRKAMPAMTPEAISTVNRMRAISLTMPQIDNRIEHALHGGMYHRTGHYPKGAILTSVFVRVPTLLIVRGEVDIFVGEENIVRVRGYEVVEGQANRQPAFHFLADTDMTMVFATGAATVEDAEEEITPEPHMLQNRREA
jgi:hypothetical protein